MPTFACCLSPYYAIGGRFRRRRCMTVGSQNYLQKCGCMTLLCIIDVVLCFSHDIEWHSMTLWFSSDWDLWVCVMNYSVPWSIPSYTTRLSTWPETVLNKIPVRSSWLGQSGECHNRHIYLSYMVIILKAISVSRVMRVIMIAWWCQSHWNNLPTGTKNCYSMLWRWICALRAMLFDVRYTTFNGLDNVGYIYIYTYI